MNIFIPFAVPIHGVLTRWCPLSTSSVIIKCTSANVHISELEFCQQTDTLITVTLRSVYAGEIITLFTQPTKIRIQYSYEYTYFDYVGWVWLRSLNSG